MDVVGSEIGQKMRSAIKAKLTELGCYVDDELPDYVMVMVANKRTRSQMEEDLALFLGDNTVLFVNWLHQVLKKLQEVTVAPAPSKPPEPEIIKPKPRSASKDKKPKDKDKKEKDKHKHSKVKGESRKKSKKKLKEKHKKKGDKKDKEHKSKKKDKDSEIKRPNVPPLLMNLEKVSEPSITDIFAGQILKNHGVTIDEPKLEKNQSVNDKKPDLLELEKHAPIIDPNTVTTSVTDESHSIENATSQNVPEVSSKDAVKPTGEEELKQIESKIEGLRQKLAVQLETMSDDEDFLNIRTEADELMNDFAEDVEKEISSSNPAPLPTAPTTNLPDTLPQIELNLPKRPARDRLGSKEEPKERREKRKKKRESDERFTPEKTPDFWPKSRSAKSRLGEPPETAKSSTHDNVSDKNGTTKTHSNTRVSPPSSGAPLSVVRVRPRPRPATTAPQSNLLRRAMADAHKSLINIPPKQEPEQKMRALVLPMRRTEPQKILVQVPADKVQSPNSRDESECELELDTDSLADLESDGEKKDTTENEYVPISITRKVNNTNYIPSRREINNSTVDETIVVQTINNSATVKEKGPTFVVTLDGLDPNIFLAKKLKTEGLLEDEQALQKQIRPMKKPTEQITQIAQPTPKVKITFDKKRLSDTSEESDTQVIIESQEKGEKRKNEAVEEVVEVKKRKASPIVFETKEARTEERMERERTESVSSDKTVVISTTASSNKFDSVPSLPPVDRKPLPCRAFPLCRFGASCAFTHPPCKFSTACSRRNCIYSHPHAKVGIASHVVPAVNFKSITTAPPIPNLCKFYPNCVNISCHFYHPKPCRFGPNCVNKAECNFYHHELSANKWRAA